MEDLKLERLELPKGGWVEFNDPESVRGKDVDRIRAGWQGSRVIGDALNVSMQIAAEILIAAWEIPNLPGAPTPGQSPSMWGELGWRDKQAIEAHITAATYELTGLAAIGGVLGSPRPPASE